MRVISKARLRKFWQQPGFAVAEQPLGNWYDIALDAAWQNWADLKATFPSASIVGDCVVFDIGGNKLRLITRLRYKKQRVYVLKAMTHKEYDENKWPTECGCHAPPPAKTRKKGKR